MDEFPDVVLTETQEVILNEPIYVKFKNRQTMVIEMRIMVPLGRGWY